MSRARGVGATGSRLVDEALDRTVVGGYSRVGLAVRRHLAGWPPDPPAGALTGRHVAVTGATSGLGEQAVGDLAALGATVHLVVRDPGKGASVRAALLERSPDARLQVWRCDVSDLADVERFAGEFGAEVDRLAALVHNAGVMPPQRTESVQGHELSLATHVLGPLLMTESLRPSLRAAGDARVVLVTSGGMYSQRLPVGDPEYRHGRYRGATAYARSKRVQVALLPFLAERLAGDRICVCGMHPGWVDTPGVAASLPGFARLTGPILRDPAEGADTIGWLAATAPVPRSGELWHDRRPRPKHLLAWTRETPAAARSMWEWCRLTLGLPAGPEGTEIPHGSDEGDTAGRDDGDG